MLKHLLVLTCALLASSSALAQVMARDLGDFELKLATSPTRSMAQGLVTPGSSGSFHGGLDLSHESGWYIGNWTSNLDPGKPTEIDSYAGFKRPLNNRLGYEMGLIRYSRPEQPARRGPEQRPGAQRHHPVRRPRGQPAVRFRRHPEVRQPSPGQPGEPQRRGLRERLQRLVGEPLAALAGHRPEPVLQRHQPDRQRLQRLLGTQQLLRHHIHAEGVASVLLSRQSSWRRVRWASSSSCFCSRLSSAWRASSR